MSLFLSLSPSFEFHFKTLKERRTEKKKERERERVSTWRLLRGSFCGTTFYAHFTFILPAILSMYVMARDFKGPFKRSGL